MYFIFYTLTPIDAAIGCVIYLCLLSVGLSFSGM
jgi:hypothetical protein